MSRRPLSGSTQPLEKKVPKKVKQKLNYARKNWPDKLREYQEKESILGKRGSFSKTDQDATFMRMKEDHMKNGQLKPGYNLQISTSGQYILHYSLHQSTTDYSTLIPHLEGFKQAYKTLPEELTADAGYGSEENYMFLEKTGIEAFVKYNTFDITKKRKKTEFKYPFRSENLHYSSNEDVFYCPMGQKMKFVGNGKRTTTTGFVQQVKRYRATRCQGCPLRGVCYRGKGNRTIEINFNVRRLRAKSKQNLESEKGIAHRKKRPVDVEPVFGHIKHNRGFRRFMLRGIENVQIESGLLAIAHNLLKVGA